jgi:hypothetical protein
MNLRWLRRSAVIERSSIDNESPGGETDTATIPLDGVDHYAGNGSEDCF